MSGLASKLGSQMAFARSEAKAVSTARIIRTETASIRATAVDNESAICTMFDEGLQVGSLRSAARGMSAVIRMLNVHVSASR